MRCSPNGSVHPANFAHTLFAPPGCGSHQGHLKGDPLQECPPSSNCYCVPETGEEVPTELVSVTLTDPIAVAGPLIVNGMLSENAPPYW